MPSAQDTPENLESRALALLSEAYDLRPDVRHFGVSLDGIFSLSVMGMSQTWALEILASVHEIRQPKFESTVGRFIPLFQTRRIDGLLLVTGPAGTSKKAAASIARHPYQIRHMTIGELESAVRAEALPKPGISPPHTWAPHREDTIQRLHDLRRVLRETTDALRLVEKLYEDEEVRSHGGIGHNTRGADERDFEPDVVEAVDLASEVLLTELEKAHPSVSATKLAASSLARIAKWASAVLGAIAAKGDRFLNAYLDQAAKPAVLISAAVLIEKLHLLSASLDPLLTSLKALLKAADLLSH